MTDINTHVIGFSGGIASSVTASLVLHDHPEAVLLFHDTKTEPHDNDRFRADVAEYLQRPITEDSDGRDIWQVFEDEGYLGNGRNTMCSRILKQERSQAFLQAHQPAVLYIGFTIDEYHRAQRVFSRYRQQNIEVKFPLIEQKISKAECFYRVTQCWGLQPPLMYQWAYHANCIPCIKGGKAYWGLIFLFEQAAWKKASMYEEKFGHTIFTEAGSLKDELPNCIRLAKKYIQKKAGRSAQGELFRFPCECAV